jgi:hypothetical protein
MNMNKKKSTSEEVLIPRQDYGTTPEAKSEAEMLFDMIGTGAAYALKRPKGKVDRILRRLISEANKTGDCIINTGFGYYRPGPDDEDDLKQYLWMELHRAEVIEDKVQSMREAYYGRY